MTTIEAIEKIEEMINTDKDKLIQTCKRLLDSGAVDVQGAENNYRLPKIILSAALHYEAAQYAPLGNSKDRKILNNLKHF